MMTSAVHVVHCVDTEGPLHESVEATFERLQAMFGLELEPSTRTLESLQNGDLDLGGLESAVQKVVDPHLLDYKDTWDKLDAMLRDCLSPDFRNLSRDSAGGGWRYNWFCVDHVDYNVNPRRRDIGYHNVFDHYRAVIRDTASEQDGVHFHYHPHNFRREAHQCATHWWASSDSLHQTLSRRVIDRRWFPAVVRPGFHVIRPDSHWFLEQFIPFDYSSQAGPPAAEEEAQSDIEAGRFGDWRRAPSTWQPYHPSHDDYQVPGQCRRWIARCLNIGTRYRLLTEGEIRQAFQEASEGRPVVLAFTNHDFRDMRPDIQEVRDTLARVSVDFPHVPFRFCEALDALRQALHIPAQSPCEFDMSLQNTTGDGFALTVRSTTPTFGPQPWLALKTTSGTYHFDNFDIEEPFLRWRYVLDGQTFPLRAVDSIGVAANNSFGVTSVSVLDVMTGETQRTYWNAGAASNQGNA